MKEYDEAIKELTKPEPPPQRLKMQMGMPINFHGYAYKVIKVMKRGRVILKLQGVIPDKEETP